MKFDREKGVKSKCYFDTGFVLRSYLDVPGFNNFEDIFINKFDIFYRDNRDNVVMGEKNEIQDSNYST